jgi:NAD(P)-dependent dehydrogenase (short-subunit alcohol dehydrogenase family)
MVVFITGAARGIGAESARRLAARGAKVVLVGLEPDALEAVARSCGPDALAVEADVTDRAALDAAVEQAVDRFGGIDVVVANAGIAAAGSFRDTDADRFERVIEINLLGVVRTVKACLPQLLERRGYVLNIASLAAIQTGFPFSANYATAKAGVEAFSNSIRLELRHHGVDVGVGYFSWIASDMVTSADEHEAFRLLRSTMKGPFGKTYPLSVAADAIVRGIDARARHVVAPSWVRWMLPLRGLLPYVAERDVLKIVPEGERLLEAEGGSVVMGPGGQAGMHERAPAG